MSLSGNRFPCGSIVYDVNATRKDAVLRENPPPVLTQIPCQTVCPILFRETPVSPMNQTQLMIHFRARGQDLLNCLLSRRGNGVLKPEVRQRPDRRRSGDTLSRHGF
jgi:hypothetical protein